MYPITISQYNQKVLFVYFLFIFSLFNLSRQSVPNSEWHNKDLYNTAQELLDSVPNVNDRRQNVAAAPINVDFVKKWLHKYIDGFVCQETSFVALKQLNVMNAEFRENYGKVQNNFCKELKSGKSIEEAMASVQNEAVKLIKNFAYNPNNKKIIDQKALRNLFPNNIQQDKIERLMKQFHLALYSFIESIKAKTSSSSTIFWAHRENGFNYQQHHSMAQQQRRRRRQRRGKSMKTFDGITQGGGGGVEAAANPLCILFLLLAMAALVGLIVGLGVPSLDHHAKLPVIIISVVVLVFNLVLLCAMCNLPE